MDPKTVLRKADQENFGRSAMPHLQARAAKILLMSRFPVTLCFTISEAVEIGTEPGSNDRRMEALSPFFTAIPLAAG
jgi:hypothetical protein